MEKISSYETLFAINGNLAEEEAKAVEEKFVSLIKENASEVAVDEWGKRKLAYTINYINEAYYVLVNYKSEPTFPLELERLMGINENVIRYMTTVKIEKKARAKARKPEAKPVETVEVAETTEA